MKLTRNFPDLHNTEKHRNFHRYMGEILAMRPGGKRRVKIMQMFMELEGLQLSVNVEGCPIIKYDPDLKRLLKEGWLKQAKRSYGMFHATQSYLYLP